MTSHIAPFAGATPACIFCDGIAAHDPACPILIDPPSLSDVLNPGELDLLARRADAFLASENTRALEKHLTRAATMSLLALTRRALLPGGKDPAMTALRATKELFESGEQWLQAVDTRPRGDGEDEEDRESTRLRSDAPKGHPNGTPPPLPKRHSRRRRV